MRKKIVAGNWKMNVDLNESIDLIEAIKNIYDNSDDVEHNMNDNEFKIPSSAMSTLHFFFRSNRDDLL